MSNREPVSATSKYEGQTHLAEKNTPSFSATQPKEAAQKATTTLISNDLPNDIKEKVLEDILQSLAYQSAHLRKHDEYPDLLSRIEVKDPGSLSRIVQALVQEKIDYYQSKRIYQTLDQKQEGFLKDLRQNKEDASKGVIEAKKILLQIIQKDYETFIHNPDNIKALYAHQISTVLREESVKLGKSLGKDHDATRKQYNEHKMPLIAALEQSDPDYESKIEENRFDNHVNKCTKLGKDIEQQSSEQWIKDLTLPKMQELLTLISSDDKARDIVATLENEFSDIHAKLTQDDVSYKYQGKNQTVEELVTLLRSFNHEGDEEEVEVQVEEFNQKTEEISQVILSSFKDKLEVAIDIASKAEEAAAIKSSEAETQPKEATQEVAAEEEEEEEVANPEFTKTEAKPTKAEQAVSTDANITNPTTHKQGERTMANTIMNDLLEYELMTNKNRDFSKSLDITKGCLQKIKDQDPEKFLKIVNSCRKEYYDEETAEYDTIVQDGEGVGSMINNQPPYEYLANTQEAEEWITAQEANPERMKGDRFNVFLSSEITDEAEKMAKQQGTNFQSMYKNYTQALDEEKMAEEIKSDMPLEKLDTQNKELLLGMINTLEQASNEETSGNIINTINSSFPTVCYDLLEGVGNEANLSVALKAKLMQIIPNLQAELDFDSLMSIATINEVEKMPRQQGTQAELAAEAEPTEAEAKEPLIEVGYDATPTVTAEEKAKAEAVKRVTTQIVTDIIEYQYACAENHESNAKFDLSMACLQKIQDNNPKVFLNVVNRVKKANSSNEITDIQDAKDFLQELKEDTKMMEHGRLANEIYLAIQDTGNDISSTISGSLSSRYDNYAQNITDAKAEKSILSKENADNLSLEHKAILLKMINGLEHISDKAELNNELSEIYRLFPKVSADLLKDVGRGDNAEVKLKAELLQMKPTLEAAVAAAAEADPTRTEADPIIAPADDGFSIMAEEKAKDKEARRVTTEIVDDVVKYQHAYAEQYQQQEQHKQDHVGMIDSSMACLQKIKDNNPKVFLDIVNRIKQAHSSNAITDIEEAEGFLQELKEDPKIMEHGRLASKLYMAINETAESLSLKLDESLDKRYDKYVDSLEEAEAEEGVLSKENVDNLSLEHKAQLLDMINDLEGDLDKDELGLKEQGIGYLFPTVFQELIQKPNIVKMREEEEYGNMADVLKTAFLELKPNLEKELDIDSGSVKTNEPSGAEPSATDPRKSCISMDSVADLGHIPTEILAMRLREFNAALSAEEKHSQAQRIECGFPTVMKDAYKSKGDKQYDSLDSKLYDALSVVESQMKEKGERKESLVERMENQIMPQKTQISDEMVQKTLLFSGTEAPVTPEPETTKPPVASRPAKPPVAQKPAKPPVVAQKPAKPPVVAQKPAKPPVVAQKPAKQASANPTDKRFTVDKTINDIAGLFGGIAQEKYQAGTVDPAEGQGARQNVRYMAKKYDTMAEEHSAGQRHNSENPVDHITGERSTEMETEASADSSAPGGITIMEVSSSEQLAPEPNAAQTTGENKGTGMTL